MSLEFTVFSHVGVKALPNPVLKSVFTGVHLLKLPTPDSSSRALDILAANILVSGIILGHLCLSLKTLFPCACVRTCLREGGQGGGGGQGELCCQGWGGGGLARRRGVGWGRW